MGEKNECTSGPVRRTSLGQLLRRNGLIGMFAGVGWFIGSVLLGIVSQGGDALGGLFEPFFWPLTAFFSGLALLGLFDGQLSLLALILLPVAFAMTGFVCAVGITLLLQAFSFMRRKSQ